MVGGRGASFARAIALLVLSGCSAESRKPAVVEPAALSIVATEHGYESQTRMPSGLTHVVFENRDTTIHEAMFIKMAPGMSAADYVGAVKGGDDFPPGALDYSGPGLTSPGERVEIWLRLDPGEYLLGCWYRGHLRTAPIQTLTVGPDSAAGAAPPAHDATLKLVDFEFQLEGTIQAGERVLRIETKGPSMHEMDIFRLDDGKTSDDLRAWMKSGKRGDSPARSMGGVLDSHDLSRVVWLKRDFPPGRYVLWCGMDMVANVDDAGTHADAGMVREFEVIATKGVS